MSAEISTPSRRRALSRYFALQSPSNPNRATRSGVEEKNGISAEGRAKRVMPDFFFHSATRCATRATFQDKAKRRLFFERSSHRCKGAFCQLNIEVSSLQVCRSSTPRQFTSYPQLVLASLHDALYASVRVKRSATNLPTSLCSQGMLRAHTTSKPIAVCPFGLVLHKSSLEGGIDHIPNSGQAEAF